MAVRIEKTFQVQEPIDKVWALLSDPRNVAGCVPGAQITEAVDHRTFKGSVSVKVGPSVTNYKGEVRFERLDAAAHEMELVGKGQDVKGRGSASMKMTGRLRSLPDGGTEVATVAEVNVIGILAQFGGRVINDVSDIMFGEFTKRFQQQLHQSAEPAAPPVPAETAGAHSSAAPEPAAPVHTAPEPVNAPEIFLKALRAAFLRFFHRLFGGPS
jgi:carbon monoxide dehydrogenase subunit G